jgi:hypothetical protein
MAASAAVIALSAFPFSRPLFAKEILKREPVVPAGVAFVRQLDVEGYLERQDDRGSVAHSVRIRTRYLDPDVNAFVGLLVGVHHFNQDLLIGKEPPDQVQADVLCNWGADFGVVRGNHLWELDLMGVVARSRLGPAVAIVGEHQLSNTWFVYHRTEANLFTNDAVLDLDQGFSWRLRPSVGLTFGYRIFAAKHMNRNGPRVGVRLLFESPKIPFLFPSLG